MKKFGFLKIVHEKYKHGKKGVRGGGGDSEASEFVTSLNVAMEHNSEIMGLVPKIQVRLPTKFRQD